MTKKSFMVIMMTALLPLATPQLNAAQVPVQLQVRYDDPKINQSGGPKSPVLVPGVSIDDYVLTFDASCLGCELRLMDEDGDVVYTSTITSSTLVLPSYLSGEYELQIIRGNWCFYGYIEL